MSPRANLKEIAKFLMRPEVFFLTVPRFRVRFMLIHARFSRERLFSERLANVKTRNVIGH
jgi:heme/copper-type cytochrome/quinol oxidase subunit 1